MGSEAKRSLAAAEKLLKQDKVDEALARFNRAIEETKGDLLTVNRVGDALASAGHAERAVPYFSRIADQFTRQGFFPKAIAIRKKILRLMPDSVETLVGLGDLCVRQEHPGDARAYYLRAAEQLLRDKDYDATREIYERLVQAEPDDPRHRVRLAETRAIAGDAAGAAGDLIELGQRLLQAGEPADAEKAFNRAHDLDAERPEIFTGRIDCMTATDRVDEALGLLEEAAGKPDAAIEWVARLLVLYETHGRTEKADGLLGGEHAHEIPDHAFRAILQFHDQAASMPALWTRLEPVLAAWLADQRKDRAVALLDAIPAWLDGAFEPALERRLAHAVEVQDEPTQCVLLERLIAAYRENGQTESADRAVEQLAGLRPPASVESQTVEVSEDDAQPGSRTAVEETGTEVPIEYEAPAVPLSRADEEFVSGRLTQAEILEKYGLLTQAVDQLYEVVERFPGHLEANQRLVTLLRGSSQEAPLAQALVKLSIARRAAGRIDVARQSVAEADRLGGIDETLRRILTALDLLSRDSTTTTAEPASEPARVVATPAPAPEVEAPRPVPEVAPRPAPEAAVPPPTSEAAVPAPAPAPIAEIADSASGSETVIDFDAFDDDDETGDAIPDLQAPASAPQEVLDEARVVQPLAAIEVSSIDAAPSLPPRITDDAMRFEPLPALDDDQDDDDLAAIAAALDDELFEQESTELTPISESEESIDEVFAAFRARVEEQVAADDFRTHYDLGIGYKEMGLIDAAIAEFEVSIKSEDLFQQSCVMLALCCREQAQLDRAVEWYRQAVGSLEGYADEACGLRYDLAEILLEVGDTESALDMFRDVAEHVPDFREVSRRMEELAPAGSD